MDDKGTVEQETNPSRVWSCQELSQQQLDFLVQEAALKSHETLSSLSGASPSPRTLQKHDIKDLILLTALQLNAR